MFGDWTWGVVVAAKDGRDIAETLEKVHAMERVQASKGEGVPVYNGSLAQFARDWGAPFEVHPQGCFVKV